MTMAAAAWDVLAKVANLAQMSGLHAAVLVAVLTTLLRVYHSNRRECARLEQCHLRLQTLLQWSASGGVAPLLPSSEAGDPFREALADAAGLVESYKNSTLRHRLWNGSRMATRLRDMRDVIDFYCGLLLFVNAHLLLLQQQMVHHPSPSSDTSTTVPEVNDDTSQSPSAQAVTSGGTSHLDVKGTQSSSEIGQGGTNYDPATESERSMPADQLPVVISHA